MPTLRVTTHRLLAGTQSVATVDADTNITDWAVQTDQGKVPWTSPDALDHPTPPQIAIVEHADGSRSSTGFYFWTWTFSYWTNDMLAYVRTNILSDAVSADVTVRTYDVEDVAVYLTATLIDPQYTGGLQPIQGGWRVTLSFTGGTIIT